MILSNIEGKMPTSTDLLQGTLDLLILQTLLLEPMHGWGVAQRIQQVSRETLQIGQGSLYPALYRLEYKGWIKAEWGTRRTIGGPSSIGSRRQGGNNWRANWRPGTGCRPRSGWCWAELWRRRDDGGAADPNPVSDLPQKA